MRCEQKGQRTERRVCEAAARAKCGTAVWKPGDGVPDVHFNQEVDPQEPGAGSCGNVELGKDSVVKGEQWYKDRLYRPTRREGESSDISLSHSKHRYPSRTLSTPSSNNGSLATSRLTALSTVHLHKSWLPSPLCRYICHERCSGPQRRQRWLFEVRRHRTALWVPLWVFKMCSQPADHLMNGDDGQAVAPLAMSIACCPSTEYVHAYLRCTVVPS